ncbi:MAG: DUF6515 family protein [Halopseudomonas sp.]|uniref:DUF6515 family protein n=1 Tax=Halopseudomonas sp. TaxID=2901191 RepID=UPI003001B0E3
MHQSLSRIPTRLTLLLAVGLLSCTAALAAPGGEQHGERGQPNQQRSGQAGAAQPTQGHSPRDAPRAQPHRQSQPVLRRGDRIGQLPSGYRQIHHREQDYYYARGAWYRPYSGGFVVVMPPVGLSIPILPDGYITLTIGGRPYYRYNDVYYTRRGNSYVVIEAPAQTATAAVAPDELFIYPARNQSSAQQSQDRYECHEWGSSQTGYDPTLAYGGVDPGQADSTRAQYHRAMTACLEARGYSVR